ncbi:MAG UNVERIFIED_CONTAM: hypothetical protein LVR18_46090 [Planctomycetaceae bacterium]
MLPVVLHFPLRISQNATPFHQTQQPMAAPQLPAPPRLHRLLSTPLPSFRDRSVGKTPHTVKRHFHSPTGITEQTTVHLQIETLAAIPGIVLNGQAVSPDHHSHDPAIPGAGTYWFPIKPLLQRFNVVMVEFAPAAAANSPQLPTLVAVSIMIDEVA